MKSKAFLAVVTLKDNWKLKTKFKSTLQNTSLSEQRKSLEAEIAPMVRQINIFRKAFRTKPVSQMSVKAITNALVEADIKKFVDLEFPPSDLSVYNHVNAERPLDVAIHWRRPDEFLYSLGDLNTIDQREDGAVKDKKALGIYHRNNNESKFERGIPKSNFFDSSQIHVFYDSIEPNDVKTSCE